MKNWIFWFQGHCKVAASFCSQPGELYGPLPRDDMACLRSYDGRRPSGNGKLGPCLGGRGGLFAEVTPGLSDCLAGRGVCLHRGHTAVPSTTLSCPSPSPSWVGLEVPMASFEEEPEIPPYDCSRRYLEGRGRLSEPPCALRPLPTSPVLPFLSSYPYHLALAVFATSQGSCTDLTVCYLLSPQPQLP